VDENLSECCYYNIKFSDDSICKAMQDIARFHRRLFEVTAHIHSFMAFVVVGLNAVAFSDSAKIHLWRLRYSKIICQVFYFILWNF
jgi:hypothetical protein